MNDVHPTKTPLRELPQRYQRAYWPAVKIITGEVSGMDLSNLEDDAGDVQQAIVEASREEADHRFGLAMYESETKASERAQDCVMCWRTHVEREVMRNLHALRDVQRSQSQRADDSAPAGVIIGEVTVHELKRVDLTGTTDVTVDGLPAPGITGFTWTGTEDEDEDAAAATVIESMRGTREVSGTFDVTDEGAAMFEALVPVDTRLGTITVALCELANMTARVGRVIEPHMQAIIDDPSADPDVRDMSAALLADLTDLNTDLLKATALYARAAGIGFDVSDLPADVGVPASVEDVQNAFAASFPDIVAGLKADPAVRDGSTPQAWAQELLFRVESSMNPTTPSPLFDDASDALEAADLSISTVQHWVFVYDQLVRLCGNGGMTDPSHLVAFHACAMYGTHDELHQLVDLLLAGRVTFSGFGTDDISC